MVNRPNVITLRGKDIIFKSGVRKNEIIDKAKPVKRRDRKPPDIFTPLKSCVRRKRENVLYATALAIRFMHIMVANYIGLMQILSIKLSSLGM